MVLKSTETIRLIRGVGRGKGIWRRGKREIIYLSPHCHHQNDSVQGRRSCSKLGLGDSKSQEVSNGSYMVV